MCLYPKLINNPKYKKNKKNGGIIPKCKDERMKKVPVGCGQCMECMKQKARGWSLRLQEEIRTNKGGEFVTLTFSNEQLRYLLENKDTDGKPIKGKNPITEGLTNLEGYELDNELAKLGVRRFLERWRKKYGISIKHWLITELGHNGTENIHIHGILFKNEYKGYEGLRQQYLNEQKEDIEKIWKYGFVWIGTYVNEATINYIAKYVTKQDKVHTQYRPRILTSAGIGSEYINRTDAKLNKYVPRGTREYYTTRQGTRLNLPIYYRNKIYTEEERELLWIEKLNKETRYVNGIKISTKHGTEEYYKTLEEAQRKNIELGYGTGAKDWNKESYELDRRKINMQKRLTSKEKRVPLQHVKQNTKKHGKQK